MKADFFTYQAQTTPHPLAMEVDFAEGSFVYTTDGKKHLDFVAGVSACGLGHRNPKVVNAVKEQIDKYWHVMVYGEYIQQPAVEFTKLLAHHLPKNLQKTYLVNSGTEAIDGAMKLARRATGRSQIIAAKNAYHGNSYGALSLMDNQERTEVFKPLVGDITHLEFNQTSCLQQITNKTAAVVLETIQGGAGFIEPTNNYLQKVKQRCEEVDALLILDEIQPGFGRTGKLFGFEHYNIVPDILVIGKGMASGLPVGAFIASTEMMDLLSDKPKLGHITTFGGNPVIAAAALATLKELTTSNIIDLIPKKEQLFRRLLQHELIKEIRGKGLMLALIFEDAEIANQLVLMAKEKELILFWLLFEKRAVRISPPLTITEEEIKLGCSIILECLIEIKTAKQSSIVN
ncbi:aspartate aminotransferase family protein [Psychroflexus planctonicus]|uniref:Aspartate aminotransferase family protein n=1 Tax=Psychroflexus planctonicus TaxID=1526575 RepID=A0ABQ1SG17_9FLAO|nr:aspartate aminotransferase family protein [Psychroflexus planctonicus]GGE31053.1 aspartate aminotransferase family protein [Psychroflexus planctonicus]